MTLSDYFQLTPIPDNVMSGTYDWHLVLLSYLVAAFASYVALDMAGRLRDQNNSRIATVSWLLGGSFAMGAGIWSMHFIGMLAFKMAMPMTYDPLWTAVSMGVAMLASLIALSLLIGQSMRRSHLVAGGFFLGVAIAAMHYTGMYAMTDSMIIHYKPSLYALSLLVAIIAAEAALWLAIKSNQGVLRVKIRLKIMSALVMGAAICGMHYIGMAAAFFFPKVNAVETVSTLDPGMLGITIAGVAFLILGVAFAFSTFREVANQQLVTTARLAGMAEVSSNVLHSVGNVLNSLNVSVHSVAERVDNAKIADLGSLNDIFQENKNNLSAFFSTDPRASHIADYLQALTDYWQRERATILSETQSILQNVSHIKNIISTQQSLSGNFAMPEQITDIQSSINEAITIAGISLIGKNIQVHKEFEAIKPFSLDKIKLLQILVNLVRNAKDALILSQNEEKVIFIKLYVSDKNTVFLTVGDNGVGIKPQDLAHIFIHGFTTKESGHGFGLHSSAILAQQMGGTLTCKSAGEGTGATFILTLPYRLS